MSALDWSSGLAALDDALESATGQDLVSGEALRAQLVALAARYDGRWSVAVDTAKTTWLADAGAAWAQADEAARYVEATSGTVAAWEASTAYVVGQTVMNDGSNVYKCRTAGTSAGSGGPTGTTADITDGTAHWRYISGAALTFDPYSSAAVVARCDAAIVLTSVAALKTMLAAQRDAVAAYYSGTVATAAFSVAPTSLVTTITGKAPRPPPVNVYALKYDEIVALDEAKQLPFDRWKAAVRLPWAEQLRLRAEAERAIAAFNPNAGRTTTETVLTDDSVLVIEGQLFVLLAGVTEFIAAIDYP